MTPKFSSTLFFPTMFVFVLLFGNLFLVAQENNLVKERKPDSRFVLRLPGSQVSGDANYIFISDSINSRFVPVKITLGNQDIWMKQSRKRATRQNTVHWYYNNEKKLLQIDISGIKSRFRGGGDLQVEIISLKNGSNHHLFSVFESSSDSETSPDFNKIIDATVEPQ